MNRLSEAGNDVPGDADQEGGGTGSDDPPDPSRPPIDLVTISHTVDQALARRLALPDRAWVDSTTVKLRGHLELLLGEDLGDIDTPESRALYRDAYAVLDRTARPNPDTPPGYAYEHMRALAAAVRPVVAAYRLRHADG
ncbi:MULTISPECIES: DUF6415 family natural product biosynthesis protein [unclassified Streptomyces]|uniref:DUF6415 family natural product biosynthesis protein n=1 Tax=unclassified Streptomyces TaxID=2593676 RepID=UPI00099B8717|nr:DUF6415 family natural product biosynthesis protein [Streptomyces sp. NBC_00370]